ncbi:MAG TPA: 50S ribosomal protein L1 [Spirochaetia bacterium]|nr:50S ribosomal protein L1 [Spirochaetia bacterium]
MGRRSKKYREALTKFDRTAIYPLEEAVKLLKELSYTKFDATVEVCMNLNLKKSHTVRDTVVLPHQFQKGQKILVFAKGDKAEEAKQAGATYVGDMDLIEKIKGGWLDFDVAVATPDMMKDVGKLGPILGRKGLMPNPKTHTVTFDLKDAIAELQKGRTEFRADKTGVIHIPIAKVSMDNNSIRENIELFLNEVSRKRPSDLKGEFVKSISISSTMSPGIEVQKLL